MKDGLVLMYVKDNTLYPVVLTQEQVDIFEIIQQTLPQPIRVISNEPIGKAVNLIEKKLI